MKLQNQKGNMVILPIHSKDIPYGTFISLLKQANLDIQDAKKFLGK
ncbi:hypothetical protein IJM86_00875 [bacterium]|nr:hypothetical protein [bacterium]